MTLAWDSKAEYEKEKAKERNPNITDCTNCGLETSDQEWIRDNEGYKFCSKDCKKMYNEETEQ